MHPDKIVPPASAFEATQDIIQAYDRYGVVLLDQPFGRYWIDEMARRMEGIVHDVQTGKLDYPNSSSGRVEIYNTVNTDLFFRRFICESGAAQICGRIIGSKSIRFYFDVTFCKFPAAAADAAQAVTTLHHDVSAFGFKGWQQPALWLALSDVTKDDAPLVVALGSHHKVTDLFRSSGTNSGDAPAPGYRDHTEVFEFIEHHGFDMKIFPVKKGDALVINPYVLHGSVPSTNSRKPRLGFCSRWIGDDVRWAPSPYTLAEAGSYPREIPLGARPPEEIFPIIWREGNRQPSSA